MVAIDSSWSFMKIRQVSSISYTGEQHGDHLDVNAIYLYKTLPYYVSHRLQSAAFRCRNEGASKLGKRYLPELRFILGSEGIIYITPSLTSVVEQAAVVLDQRDILLEAKW